LQPAALHWRPSWRRRRGRAAEWCARYDAYTRNCGFHTFQQCLDTVRGAGGICERNPRAAFGRDRDYYHRW
jgi:hypothetical protein